MPVFGHHVLSLLQIFNSHFTPILEIQALTRLLI